MPRSEPLSILRQVWGLLILALLLRLAVVAWHANSGYQLRHDPAMYLTLAENLRHGVYSMFHPQDIPDTIKMPGYPLYLWLLGGSVTWALILQALLSALKVPLVWVLAGRIGLGARGAFIAAALIAVEPMDILLSAQVMTESLFTLLLLAGVLALLAVYRGHWLVAALAFTAAAWIRPNGLWLVVVAAALGFLFLPQQRRWMPAFALVALLLVSPWALRNHNVLDRFYLGDSGAVAAAYYQVPAVLRAAGDPSLQGRDRRLHDRASSIDWTDRQQFHAFFDGLRTEARETMIRHPFTWLRVQTGKAMRILVAPGRGHARLLFRDAPRLAKGIIAWSALFSLAIVAALVVCLLRFRRVPPALWWMLLLAAAIIFTGALTTSDARFKNPAMPFLLVGVAWVVEELRQQLLRARPPKAPAPPA